MKSVALSLLAILALPACAATNERRDEGHLRLSCSDGLPIEVALTGRGAEVHRAGKVYRLERRDTDFKRKYASAEATYIQDGNSAVFASDDGAFAADCEVSRR